MSLPRRAGRHGAAALGALLLTIVTAGCSAGLSAAQQLQNDTADVISKANAADAGGLHAAAAVMEADIRSLRDGGKITAGRAKQLLAQLAAIELGAESLTTAATPSATPSASATSSVTAAPKPSPTPSSPPPSTAAPTARPTTAPPTTAPPTTVPPTTAPPTSPPPTTVPPTTAPPTTAPATLPPPTVPALIVPPGGSPGP